MTKAAMSVEAMDPHVVEITEGNASLIQRLSNDANRIGIMRAIHLGYAQACIDNDLPVPEFEDPAVSLGYGG